MILGKAGVEGQSCQPSPWCHFLQFLTPYNVWKGEFSLRCKALDVTGSAVWDGVFRYSPDSPFMWLLNTWEGEQLWRTFVLLSPGTTWLFYATIHLSGNVLRKEWKEEVLNKKIQKVKGTARNTVVKDKPLLGKCNSRQLHALHSSLEKDNLSVGENADTISHEV